MTTKHHFHAFHANPICAAFEAASKATRAEFLEWLDGDRVPSPLPTEEELVDALFMPQDEPRPVSVETPVDSE